MEGFYLKFQADERGGSEEQIGLKTEDNGNLQYGTVYNL